MTTSRRGRARSEAGASGRAGGERLTVGRLARRFGLSRSALLYYHRLGLLVPSSRGHGGYRLYSEDDVRRLEQIVRYRSAGVPLADIRRILDGPDDGLSDILERRLVVLNHEIAELREQQRVIVDLLRVDRTEARTGVLNRERWTRMLEAAGYDEDDMRNWHITFERHDPEAHVEFLRFLSIPEDEIDDIRRHARAVLEAGPKTIGPPARPAGTR